MPIWSRRIERAQVFQRTCSAAEPHKVHTSYVIQRNSYVFSHCTLLASFSKICAKQFLTDTKGSQLTFKFLLLLSLTRYFLSILESSQTSSLKYHLCLILSLQSFLMWPFHDVPYVLNIFSCLFSSFCLFKLEHCLQLQNSLSRKGLSLLLQVSVLSLSPLIMPLFRSSGIWISGFESTVYCVSLDFSVKIGLFISPEFSVRPCFPIFCFFFNS